MGQSASSEGPSGNANSHGGPTEVEMQQKGAINGGPSSHPKPAAAAAATPAHEPRRLSEEERAIVWEINIARGCLESFSKILAAHAIVLSLLVTVNLIGFLQPPRGWDQDGLMFSHSYSVRAFAVANSLSLYSAISGLLFYIYCSYATIVSLGAVPLLDRFDEKGLELLHVLRASLRCVALPSVKRRSSLLSSFLAFSLTFCVAAYISSGVASAPPEDRFFSIVLPAIPGCILVIILLHLSSSKLRKELDFDARFKMLWNQIFKIQSQPALFWLDRDSREALDPTPAILWWNVGRREEHCNRRRNDHVHRPPQSS